MGRSSRRPSWLEGEDAPALLRTQRVPRVHACACVCMRSAHKLRMPGAASSIQVPLRGIRARTLFAASRLTMGAACTVTSTTTRKIHLHHCHHHSHFLPARSSRAAGPVRPAAAVNSKTVSSGLGRSPSAQPRPNVAAQAQAVFQSLASVVSTQVCHQTRANQHPHHHPPRSTLRRWTSRIGWACPACPPPPPHALSLPARRLAAAWARAGARGRTSSRHRCAPPSRLGARPPPPAASQQPFQRPKGRRALPCARA